jgi:hypothetical protein
MQQQQQQQQQQRQQPPAMQQLQSQGQLTGAASAAGNGLSNPLTELFAL